MAASRALLGAAAVSAYSGNVTGVEELSLDGNAAITAVSYPAVLELFAFLVAITAAGALTNWLRMTALVGEIIAGALLGPPLAAFLRYPSALMLVGEVGLLLAIVEAGLHVQLPALRQVGARGVVVALTGTLGFPLPVAFGLCRAFGLLRTEAMAVAVCLVPSSTGVALLILRRAKTLNTPTGQLVVASTALCDIIALVFISELRALKHPSAAAFVTPALAAVGYVIGVGLFAVYVVPPALQRLLLAVPPRLLEKTALGALAALVAGLCTALEHGGSSYLLGAFLAGVCFCTLPSITHSWERQVKRLQTWLLRLFFSATVAFEVPITRFGARRVLALAALLLLPIACKAATGALAKPRHAPQALTLAFSMTTLGELSFVAAVVGHHEMHIISGDTFASICVAIIVSNMVGPALLRRTLRYYAAAARRSIEAAMAAALSTEPREEDGGEHGGEPSGKLSGGGGGDAGGAPGPSSEGPGSAAVVPFGAVIYYKLTMRCLSRWGLLADVLRALGDAGVAVIEFRSDASGEDALYEAFLKDLRVRDPRPSVAGDPALAARAAEVRAPLAALLAHDGGAAGAAAAAAESAGDAEGALRYAGGETTVDFRALRGVLLRRWLPGGSPSEWAAAGEEDAEAQVTLQMKAEVAAGRRAAGGGHATLAALFPTAPMPLSGASSAASISSPAPGGAGDGGSPTAGAAALSRASLSLRRSPPSRDASRQLDDAAEDGVPAPAHAPAHLHAATSSAATSAPLGSAALARAQAVDLAFAAVEAEAELEKAREAQKEDPRGLLGFLRAHRPADLQSPGLAHATSAAAAQLVAAAAAAEVAADAADAATDRAGGTGTMGTLTRRIVSVTSGGLDPALIAAALAEGDEAAAAAAEAEEGAAAAAAAAAMSDPDVLVGVTVESLRPRSLDGGRPPLPPRAHELHAHAQAHTHAP